MRFAKKVIVAIGISDELTKLLAPLKEMSFLNDSEVHFVHVYNSVDYSTMIIGDFSFFYPDAKNKIEIKESILSLLIQVSKDVLPEAFKGKVIHRCLFDQNPKKHFADYVKELNGDLVIIPTRQKHGLFDSSFAQYVNKHSSANMIFLKSH